MTAILIFAEIFSLHPAPDSPLHPLRLMKRMMLKPAIKSAPAAQAAQR